MHLIIRKDIIYIYIYIYVFCCNSANMQINYRYLEVDLSGSGRVGGHASLEHAPATGLGRDGTGYDALTVGVLDDRLHVGRTGGHLQPRCTHERLIPGSRKMKTTPLLRRKSRVRIK
jgi:hypothetical protein